MYTLPTASTLTVALMVEPLETLAISREVDIVPRRNSKMTLWLLGKVNVTPGNWLAVLGSIATDLMVVDAEQLPVLATVSIW